jgi:hypothetical protein
MGEPREGATADIKIARWKIDQVALRKLRQAYQVALISLLRKEEVNVSMARLSAVLARLRDFCHSEPSHFWWQETTVFVDGLPHDVVALDADSVAVLRLIEGEIKGFIDAHAQGLDWQATATVMAKLQASLGAGQPLSEVDQIGAQDVPTLLQRLEAQIHTSSQSGGRRLDDMRICLEALQNAAYQTSLYEMGDLCLIFSEVLAVVSADELAQEQTQTDLFDWLERLSTSYNEVS